MQTSIHEYTYPFTELQAQTAYETWGANCGPNSLAFSLQIPIDDVRGKIPGFEEKRYTSPTMMKAGLAAFGKTVTCFPGMAGLKKENPECPRGMNLVRIQWTGPWTAPGANPKWAYRQTHWICCWRVELPETPLGHILCPVNVFDCNGGIRRLTEWEKEIVPALTAQTKRADGGWFATHVWGLD